MRAFLVLLLAAVAQCRLAPLHSVNPSIQGQYIVALEDGVNVGAFAANLRVGSVRKTLRGIINAVVLNIDNVDLIRHIPGIKYIEEDGIATVLDNREASAFWGLDRVDQEFLPLDGNIDINGDGSGSNVYIIDTGIRYTHDEFEGRAALLFDYEGGDGSDCHSHGTHCAGTAAGSFSGVASNANIFSVRVMSCSGSGSYSAIIEGLNAVSGDSRSNKVASMSIGGGYSLLLNNAVANAHAAGVTVVVAGGNSNDDACSYSPASAPDAITVGATTSADRRSSFSNYGSCTDIFAPGSSILSASYSSDTGYTTMSGTSMACPHVAGASAVLLSNGETNVAGKLTTDATKDALILVGTGSPNLLLFLH